MESKKSVKHNIAVFDFDGTITKKDTLIHFTQYCFGWEKLFRGLIVLSPILIFNKLKLVSSHNAKNRFLKYFFSGIRYDLFLYLCKNYALEIDKIVKPEAFKKLEWHKKNGHKVVIVSASAENWISPWAIKNGVDEVIATKIEIINNKITGRLLTPNCNRKEKVTRFLNKFHDREKYLLYVYGDSNGDKPLLSIADFPYFKKFS